MESFHFEVVPFECRLVDFPILEQNGCTMWTLLILFICIFWPYNHYDQHGSIQDTYRVQLSSCDESLSLRGKFPHIRLSASLNLFVSYQISRISILYHYPAHTKNKERQVHRIEHQSASVTVLAAHTPPSIVFFECGSDAIWMAYASDVYHPFNTLSLSNYVFCLQSAVKRGAGIYYMELINKEHRKRNRVKHEQFHYDIASHPECYRIRLHDSNRNGYNVEMCFVNLLDLHPPPFSSSFSILSLHSNAM